MKIIIYILENGTFWDFKTGKYFIFCQKEAFLKAFLKPCTLHPKLEKKEKTSPKKSSYISGNGTSCH